MSAIPDMRRSQEDMFAGLRARIARQGVLVDAPPEPEPDPYVRHFDFDRQCDGAGNPRYLRPTDCEGMLCVVDRSDPVWLLRCDACGFEAGIPGRSLDADFALERLLGRSGVPERFRGVEFDTRDAAQQEAVGPCRAWLRDFDPGNPAGSLPAPGLFGSPGRGKTHLLSMMVELLIRRHRVDAVYRSASEMFDGLQAGMDSDAYEVRWRRVLEVGVLALDDLGAGRMTEWRRDRLYALVDYRLTRSLPLLLATNQPPVSWPEVFGDRVASRLRGMVVPFRLGGEDRRTQTAMEIPF